MPIFPGPARLFVSVATVFVLSACAQMDMHHAVDQRRGHRFHDGRIFSTVPSTNDDGALRQPILTNTLLQNCDPPPLGVAGWPGEGIAAWVETCRASEDLPLDELIARVCVTRPDDAALAAYAAPFPDAAYKKGMLQITCGIPIAEGAEGLEANRAAWRFLETWNKPFLTAFSDSDPATIGWETVFHRRIPGTRGQPHTRIAGAGHFVQEEQGAALAEVLIGFLRANAAG